MRFLKPRCAFPDAPPVCAAQQAAFSPCRASSSPLQGVLAPQVCSARSKPYCLFMQQKCMTKLSLCCVYIRLALRRYFVLYTYGHLPTQTS